MLSIKCVFKITIFAFAILSYGCATVATQSPIMDKRFVEESQPPRNAEMTSNIYSGVAFDFNMLMEALTAKTNDHGGKGQAIFFVGIFVLIDLPLSFVADTALLPYTIYKQNTRGDFYTCFSVRKCQQLRR